MDPGTNVGFWLQYGNSGCTVENTVIEFTDADGLNFNGNATNCTVKNNFIRNSGDNALAIWSYPTADSGITCSNNTIVQPTLANGIAGYAVRTTPSPTTSWPTPNRSAPA